MVMDHKQISSLSKATKMHRRQEYLHYYYRLYDPLAAAGAYVFQHKLAVYFLDAKTLHTALNANVTGNLELKAGDIVYRQPRL